MEDRTWEFYEELKRNRAELTALETNSQGENSSAAYDYVDAECSRLSQVRCQSCEGFGHLSAQCPTAAKIGCLSEIFAAQEEVCGFVVGRRRH